jgi:hypothetical protein
MLKNTNKSTIVLLLIFVFSFIYRFMLMTWATYPSGADIGLHNSVIHSITLGGNTDFLWNYYQMGGGFSLTFPGYHIFAAFVIFFTGMPDYLVHVFVASLFSSAIVLVSFLITRAVWRPSAALIVAFLVAISRFDIEILLWGGFPNVITLLLIPLVFYLYIQKNRFSIVPFLVSASILSGSIFLTHSLSAGLFAVIIFIVAVTALIFHKQIGIKKTVPLTYIFPLIGGAVLVSPFLIKAVPAYLTANSDTFSSGATSISQAVISTRILPTELIIALFVCAFIFFPLSKRYQSKTVTLPTLFLVAWILIPVLLTQGYLVGFYIDYNRFLYFVILPVMILIGLSIDHSATFFADITMTYQALKGKIQTAKPAIKLPKLPELKGKYIYAGIVLFLLLVSFFFVPIFLTPKEGTSIQSFYQVMTQPRYDAMQWAKENTPPNSVFVAEAYYGWWFSGFAQRPTLSAVDPQFLTLARELQPAQTAKNLLDTDYIVDNGLIQVREDGGYMGRHNPMIVADLNWTYFPYSFMNFNSSQIKIQYRVASNLQFLYLDQLPVQEMRLENASDHATIMVKKGNDVLSITQLTTIYRGSRFANITFTAETVENSVSLDWLEFFVQSNGAVIQPLRNNTVSMLDEGVKVLGQLIFSENTPEVRIINSQNPLTLDLQYNLQGGVKGTLQIAAAAYSVDDNPRIYQHQTTKNTFFNQLIEENLNSPFKTISDLPITCFDYKSAIDSSIISYILCQDSEIMPKFANDPEFNLVFINHDVAIFEVKKS